MGQRTDEDSFADTAVVDPVLSAERHASLAGRLSDLRIGSDELFLKATEQSPMAVALGDPHQKDCPLVYCNEAFTRLTGYASNEVVGRNCRFLQGRATDPAAVVKLREALAAEDYTVVEILNYRKDGTPFWNAVHVGPIYDSDGELAFFFGSQWDITELVGARERIVENERIEAELRHRTDNLFSVLTAIVRLSARGSSEVGELSAKIERRIEALASAHRVSLSPPGTDTGGSNLRTLIEAVMRPYRNSHADRIELDGNTVELPRKHVTPLGLTLHELATNALKYGALAHDEGKVHIDWSVGREWLELHWIETHGPNTKGDAPVPQGKGSGSGQRLIDGVIRGLHGQFDSQLAPSGFRATIRVPAAS